MNCSEIPSHLVSGTEQLQLKLGAPWRRRKRSAPPTHTPVCELLLCRSHLPFWNPVACLSLTPFICTVVDSLVWKTMSLEKLRERQRCNCLNIRLLQHYSTLVIRITLNHACRPLLQKKKKTQCFGDGEVRAGETTAPCQNNATNPICDHRVAAKKFSSDSCWERLLQATWWMERTNADSHFQWRPPLPFPYFYSSHCSHHLVIISPSPHCSAAACLKGGWLKRQLWLCQHMYLYQQQASDLKITISDDLILVSQLWKIYPHCVYECL